MHRPTPRVIWPPYSGSPIPSPPPPPPLRHPQPEMSSSEVRSRAESWINAQSHEEFATESSQLSERQRHRPQRTTGREEPLPDSKRLQSERILTPTEVVDTPPPLPLNASSLLRLLKSIPPDEIAQLFPGTLTLQIPLPDVLSQWAHNNTEIAGARVTISQSTTVSSHPTAETLGSQRDNPLLRSMTSVEAAELARKYPNPLETLRRFTTNPYLPPVSEAAEDASDPPSYRLFVGTSTVDQQPTALRPDDMSDGVARNEYVEALQRIMNQETASVNQALGDFSTVRVSCMFYST